MTSALWRPTINPSRSASEVTRCVSPTSAWPTLVFLCWFLGRGGEIAGCIHASRATAYPGQAGPDVTDQQLGPAARHFGYERGAGTAPCTRMHAERHLVSQCISLWARSMR